MTIGRLRFTYTDSIIERLRARCETVTLPDGEPHALSGLDPIFELAEALGAACLSLDRGYNIDDPTCRILIGTCFHAVPDDTWLPLLSVLAHAGVGVSVRRLDTLARSEREWISKAGGRRLRSRTRILVPVEDAKRMLDDYLTSQRVWQMIAARLHPAGDGV